MKQKNSLLLMVLALMSTAPVVAKKGCNVIVVTTTIQDAINQATSNTIIEIPGNRTYTEALTIPSNLCNITLRAEPGAVLDATGNDNGIYSSPTPNLPNAYVVPQVNCPTQRGIKGLTISGLTIINAAVNGIFIASVTDFKIDNVTVIADFTGNSQYGIFPICCKRGKITHCTVTNHYDAGVYVGCDHDISVHHCVAYNNAIGIEIENSINCDVQYNDSYGNDIGVLCDIDPNLPIKENSKILVANNYIHDNTVIFNNPDAGTGMPPADVTPTLAPPIGLLLLGGGPFAVVNNNIVRNVVNFVAIDLPIRWVGCPTPSDPVQPRDKALRPQRYVHDVTLVNNILQPNALGSPYPEIVFGSNCPNRENTVCLDANNQYTLSPYSAFFFNVIPAADYSTNPPTIYKDSVNIDETTAVPLYASTKPCCIPKWAKAKLRK